MERHIKELEDELHKCKLAHENLKGILKRYIDVTPIYRKKSLFVLMYCLHLGSFSEEGKELIIWVET